VKAFVCLCAVVLVAVGLGVAVLDAAGDVGPVSSASTGAGLCASIPEVTALVVTRTATISPRKVPSATVVVNVASRARAVARVACALAPFPPGLFACPADFGPDYLLTFRTAARSFRPLRADASGCSMLVGLGRTRSTTAAFWGTLRAAAGARIVLRPTGFGSLRS
jgi:hypothetical protein